MLKRLIVFVYLVTAMAVIGIVAYRHWPGGGFEHHKLMPGKGHD